MHKLFNKIYRLLFPAIDPADVQYKYDIPRTIKISIEHVNKSYVLTSPDLPGLITETNDLNNLLDIYNDAVLTYFDVPKIEADYVFDTISLDGIGTLRLNPQKKLA